MRRVVVSFEHLRLTDPPPTFPEKPEMGPLAMAANCMIQQEGAIGMREGTEPFAFDRERLLVEPIYEAVNRPLSPDAAVRWHAAFIAALAIPHPPFPGDDAKVAASEPLVPLFHSGLLSFLDRPEGSGAHDWSMCRTHRPELRLTWTIYYLRSGPPLRAAGPPDPRIEQLPGARAHPLSHAGAGKGGHDHLRRGPRAYRWRVALRAVFLRTQKPSMKTQPSITLATFLLLSPVPAVFAEDESGFTAAPPASWQRVNAIGTASFSFANGVATIAAAPPPPEQAPFIGLARGAVLGPTERTDCAVSVDVVAWSATRVFTSVITRVGTPAGLGTSRGYSFTLIPSTGAVEMHRLDGEIPTKLAPTQFIGGTPGTTYRLVLASVGDRHTARIFNTADLATPLAEVSAFDATYASGRSGIFASTDSYTTIQASYDNFLAWPGTATPLAVIPGDSQASILAVETDARRSLASFWESADDLTGGNWQPEFPTLTVQPGNTIHATFDLSEPARFFRLRLLGSQ